MLKEVIDNTVNDWVGFLLLSVIATLEAEFPKPRSGGDPPSPKGYDAFTVFIVFVRESESVLKFCRMTRKRMLWWILFSI